MKKSCTHYQCAAWAFEQLRDNVGNLGDCFDFSYEYMALHVNIMLVSVCASSGRSRSGVTK